MIGASYSSYCGHLTPPPPLTARGLPPPVASPRLAVDTATRKRPRHIMASVLWWALRCPAYFRCAKRWRSLLRSWSLRFWLAPCALRRRIACTEPEVPVTAKSGPTVGTGRGRAQTLIALISVSLAASEPRRDNGSFAGLHVHTRGRPVRTHAAHQETGEDSRKVDEEVHCVTDVVLIPCGRADG